MRLLPFWVWFALAEKVQTNKLYHTDRHGASHIKKPPYRFGDEIYVLKTYWDGGPWIVSQFNRISADDPVQKVVLGCGSGFMIRSWSVGLTASGCLADGFQNRPDWLGAGINYVIDMRFHQWTPYWFFK